MNKLTETRRLVLEELINISFGKAVGAIAEVLNTHLELQIPNVKLADSQEIINILRSHMEKKDRIDLVQQVFRGDFYGEAVLALPGSSTENIIEVLTANNSNIPDMDVDSLKKEIILEIGNIIIGTSLSQFSDLLKTTVSFSPPRVFSYELTSDHFKEHIAAQKQKALLIYTTFKHEDQKFAGYLFFFLSENCQEWLFNATDSFMENIGK